MVSGNQEQLPFPVAPLGALCVAGSLQEAGHSVDLVDLCFARSPCEDLRTVLQEGGYDAVGLSIRNLDNCLYGNPVSYFDQFRRLAETVRAAADVPLILGGSGFSAASRGWIERLDAFCGIIGEGERALPQVLEALDRGEEPDAVPNVIRRGQTRPPTPVLDIDLDCIPLPAHEHCDYEQYLSRGGFVGVQAKRGCPFHCIYCTYPLLEGCSYRVRHPERVVDEIATVHQSTGAGYYFFTDSVFNAPRDHALAICREIARRGLRVQWMSYCNPVGFDRELAHAMAEAGCIGVEFGLDAVTDKMLLAMGKPFGLDEIRVSLEAAAHARIPFAVHLLFGGPGEDVADVEDAQEFLDSCAAPDAVFASVGIRLYADTPAERIARELGALAADADLFEPVYFVSEGLGKDPVGVLDGIARRRPAWSTQADWQRPVLQVAQRLANRNGERPQWRHIRDYGEYLRW